MIVLQADPLIEWDETKPKLSEQSEDAISFVKENILSEDPAITMETVHSNELDVDWSRIKTQLYVGAGFSLNRDRTYNNTEDSSVASCIDTLIIV